MSQTHMIVETTSDAYLDGEWLQLMKEAREMGVSCEEIREYLKSTSR